MNPTALNFEEKIALLKKIKSNPFQEQPTSEVPLLRTHSRDLLNVILSKKTYPIVSTTLSCIPIEDKTLETQLLNEMDGMPLVLSIYEVHHHAIAIILLPITFSQLYTCQEVINQKVREGLRLSHSLGASTVSLAGLIPSATLYGNSVDPYAKELGLSLTIGHAGTVASMLLCLEKICQEKSIDLSQTTLSILGVGSIGESFAELLLTQYRVKRIILCELEQHKERLETIKNRLNTTYGSCVNVALSAPSALPDSVYDSELIIGATNAADIIDLKKLRPTTHILDDSIPHCFNSKEAFDYMANHPTIFTESGMLYYPEKIKEIRYLPESIEKINHHMPQIFWNRDTNEITSCILAGYLSAVYNLPSSIGITTKEQAIEFLNFFRKNNIKSAPFRLEGQLITS